MYINGKLIKNGGLHNGKNFITISDLFSRVYFIEIEIENKKITKKLIKN